MSRAGTGGERHEHGGHAGQAPFGAGETPLNRHSRQEADPALRSARATMIGQLSERGIDVTDDDQDGDIAELQGAVERFESAVMERGGDSFTNTPDSSEPDNPAFVLPTRRDDETLPAYIRRVDEATAGARQAPADDGEARAVRAEAVNDENER